MVALCMSALLVACGDDSAGSSTTTSTTTSTSTSTGSSGTADGSDPGDAASSDFALTTSDGSFGVSGPSSGCSNPDETTLDVSFSDGNYEVVVSAQSGEGSVVVPGVFEGTIDNIAVGDLGDVTISGRGGLADDSVAPTTFEVTGSCA